MTKMKAPIRRKAKLHPKVIKPIVQPALTKIDSAAMILPLNEIHIPENIRTITEGIDELANSIREHGLIQPLVVSKKDERFELVAGQRRYAALMSLGLNKAPVRIIDSDENKSTVLRLIENIQRQELSGIDEVNAVAKLVVVFAGDQSALARSLGKSKSYVSKCIKAAEFVRDNKVSPAKLSKSTLLELPYAADPQHAIEKIQNGEVDTSKDFRRQPSGAIPGGRYGDEGAIQYRERTNGNAFSLRLNFDIERTPPETKQKMIITLEQLLQRLKGT